MGRFKQIGVSIGLFTGGLFAGVSLGRSKKSSSSTVAVATGISQQQQIAASKYHTKSPSDGPSDLIDSVGNTPLLEIKSLSKLTGCKIYAKAEFMNPSGSVKDRAAKYLILDAEDKGLIQRGQSIIEATGGNTGVALALLAASRGYKVVFTMPEKTSKEKVELMKLLGAEVHVQPGVTMFEDEHFYQLAQRLHKSISNSTYPNQFENTANMRAHYTGTGPEIWHQLNGKIHGFVTSSGTGGTIAGCSKFLKEQDPNIKVWLVDPEEVSSTKNYINSNRTNSTWKEGFEVIPSLNGTTIAEGIGLGRVTPNFRQAQIDKAISGNNQEIVDMAYFLLRNEGLFVGPSAALNVCGAVKLARHLGPGHSIVTILCDGGDRYRSKLYNPEWLKEQGLKPTQVNESLDFVRAL